MAKFGDHEFCCLASILSKVVRQADKNSSFGAFFRIQYLAFGNYLVVLNAILGFGSVKNIP